MQSTITIGAPLGVGDRAQRQFLQRPGVGGRVGEQQVLEAQLGQPERLRQGEGHQPDEALAAGEDPLDQRPAAQRLARHPDRLRARAGQHRVAVGPHRIEVDEGKRRLYLGEDRLELSVRASGHAHETNRAVSREFLQSSRMPGEVAEWLKALAC